MPGQTQRFVRYPLSNYEGIWNSHVELLPLRILRHMAQYSGRSGKFATTLLRYISVLFHLGAQESRELIILCTNLTVRLN